MRKILVTGGTVFVSRFVAEYFVKQGDQVYVLNRNTKPQPEGVSLIEADRNHLGDTLKDYDFDAVLDINSYTRQDVENLVTALGNFRDYIFISSSAVYPETLPQPFTETQKCGPNSLWGAYGTNKLDAEDYLSNYVPQAYILRPPYLYGPMEHVYRAPFVFDCAEAERPFFIPGDGSLKLQFFHVEDLCRLMQILLEKHPEERIYNVGNPDAVTVREWVKLCYEAAGKPLEMVSVGEEYPTGKYFPFPTYEYFLDVSRQSVLLPEVKPLAEGIREEYARFRENREKIARRPYIDYINENFGGFMKNNYQIVPVNADNYPLFDDMLFWREHGIERPAGQGTLTETVRTELENPNLYLFAAETDGHYVGWISLVYIPKVGKWQGHGHVYVDELWVAPEYRRRGIARMLMQKADEMKMAYNAAGIRLYVNVENPDARRLYEDCGFVPDVQAIFMEKY